MLQPHQPTAHLTSVTATLPLPLLLLAAAMACPVRKSVVWGARGGIRLPSVMLGRGTPMDAAVIVGLPTMQRACMSVELAEKCCQRPSGYNAQ